MLAVGFTDSDADKLVAAIVRHRAAPRARRWHMPSRAVGLVIELRAHLRLISFIPRNLVRITTRDGDEAAQLAQQLRLAVQGILMVGSALAPAAAF
jgi:hypothetical protein